MFSLTKIVQMEFSHQVLQKHSESLSRLILPVEVVQMLYTEKIISKETLEELIRSGGSLTNGPLRALSSTISEDQSKLRVFACVLLKSENTIHVGKNILKEYGK